MTVCSAEQETTGWKAVRATTGSTADLETTGWKADRATTASISATRSALDNVGTIADFNHHDDHILLDHHVFAGLSAGSLQSSAFDVIGQGSHIDPSDRILYNAQTGDLFFDQDGSGTAHQAIRFANIANHASLNASDFLIV